MIAVDGTYGLVIEHANLMDLCRQFRELSIIFHGGFVHRNHLETLSKNASAYEIRLGFYLYSYSFGLLITTLE